MYWPTFEPTVYPGYESRVYGLGNLGNLAPLLGMGSNLANSMGHKQLANVIGSFGGLMNQFKPLFPNNPASTGSAQSMPFPFGFGQIGFPFSGFQNSGSLSFNPMGPGLTGFAPPFTGPQGSGLASFMPTLFGAPGTAGIPGFF